MKWITFKSAAYPPAFSAMEKDRLIVFHINRWIGLRFAYLFYHLGFSANLLSVFRIGISMIGLFLIYSDYSLPGYAPMIGILLLTWQVNLDFADGAIARVLGKATTLGEKFDGLANDLTRGAVLIQISIITHHYYMIIIAIFTAFILIKFFAETFALVAENYAWENYPLLVKITRSLLFVPVMVIGLPLLTIIVKLINQQHLHLFAVALTILYTVLAIIWLFIAAKSGKGKTKNG
jgi:phosphatidylglycerophosphate synthase